MPKAILELTKRYLKNPEFIKVVHKELTVPSVNQYYVEIKQGMKLEGLSRLFDLYNPKLSLMVAGTFGFVLSFLTVVITAVSIVNERRSGTFEQLQVTPATSLEIVLGKLLPLGAVFALDVVLMVCVAGFVMGVWPHGSVLLFVGISTFYVLISLALGLIFSATSATAAEAVQKTVLFSIPLVQLCGFAFPIRNMPRGVCMAHGALPRDALHPVSRAIYMRAEASRSPCARARCCSSSGSS